MGMQAKLPNNFPACSADSVVVSCVVSREQLQGVHQDGQNTEMPLQVWAVNGTHKVKVEATCDRSGTPLRAPTADSGLSPLCKDSFHGKASNVLQRLHAAGAKGAESIPAI